MHPIVKFSIVVLSCVLVFYAIVGGLLGKEVSREGAYKQLAVFSEVLLRVKTDYVEEPNMKEATAGALRGLVESLDPFSSYLTPQEVAVFEKAQKAPGDIGLDFAKKFGYVNVISTVPESPSHRAGLETGDLIESINGVSTRELNLQQVRLLLAGPVGQPITLSVLRGRRTEPVKIDVVREEIKALPLEWRMMENNVAYFKMARLSAGKSGELRNALTAAMRTGAQKVILDLRDSSDGEMAEAVAVANLFLDHGTITSIQGQKLEKQIFVAEKSKHLCNLPLAVLINRGTASASEVVAAAILENNRGEVVGEKSYGVGAVQKLFPLEDGSAIYISVGKYYSPANHVIHENGVTPNIPVGSGVEDLIATGQSDDVSEGEEGPESRKAAGTLVRPRPAEDLILKRALEVLAEKFPAQKKAA